MLATVALLALALGQTPPPAGPPREGPVSLALGVGTDFPLSVHATALLELPGRLQLSTSLGLLPRPYLRLLNDVLVEAGEYSEDEAQLIEDSLSQAGVWRTHLGWRPFPRAGFYLSGGYTLITLGGGVTGSSALFRLAGVEVPEDLLAAVQLAEARSTLHQAAAELGWQWRLPARLRLRLGVGGFTTLGASTTFTPRVPEPLASLAEPYLREAELRLDETYRERVHGAYVALALAYALF